MELAKNLKIDSVSQLGLSLTLVAAPDDTIADAVRMMQQRRVGCILVCDRGRLVGIFTERDLLKHAIGAKDALQASLRSCMTANPVVVRAKDTVGRALRQMQEGGYRHLPVVNDVGQPIGMLSVKRIIRYLVEHFPATVYNLPPVADVVPKCREGA